MSYKLATSTWGKEELDAIQAVIESDMYSMGEKVNEFEHNTSKFFGSKYSVMCSSGSAANLLMIASLFYRSEKGIQRGDEVIVPAVSWSTTYFPLQQYGLKLKFVDIDLKTLNFDLEQLESAITPKTKIILAVNLLGNPNDFNQIQSIIKGTEIILLEDNCESMGATFGEKFTGTFGLMGTFSTFFSHHIATMEGGFVLTDDEELYHILLCLRAHGWTRNLPKNNLLVEKSDDPFQESFRFILPGYNLRPVEMSGAIGIEQLKKLPDFLKNRKINAEYFKNKFQNDLRFCLQEETGDSSWFGFSMILSKESTLKRKTVIESLTKSHIDTRPIVTGDFTKNEVLKYFHYSIHGDLRNSKYLDLNGLFVGNSHENLFEQIDHLKYTLDRL
jgi:CDP-6-deoxy-D-xylo-4-hexulose-3-dehydrase